MKIAGNNTCTNCKKTYTWKYRVIERNKYTNGIYKVTKLEEGTYVDLINKNGSSFTFGCYCPYCGLYDKFEYIENN